jgi:Domain of unknown function (DUF4384)
MKINSKQHIGAIVLGSLTLALSSAFATPQISPQSIIVNPVPTDLSVNVSVDRGGSNPVYNIGDAIRVNVNVSDNAYVYLFSVHSDGQIDQILPNRLSGGSQFLRAGETRSFPPAGGAYTLSVDGPSGQDKVLAVASKRQLDTSEIASFKGNQPFATSSIQGQDNLARALSIVVQPVPASDWVTAVTYFQVQPRYGNATSAPRNNTGNNTGNTTVTTTISTTISVEYGLNVYPGSVIVRFDDPSDQTVNVQLSSNANFKTVVQFYGQELERNGWQMVARAGNGNNVRLMFRRSGAMIELEIRRISGGFELKLYQR